MIGRVREIISDRKRRRKNETKKKKVADPFDETGHERAIVRVRGLGCSIYCGKAIGSPAVHVTHAVWCVRTVRRQVNVHTLGAYSMCNSTRPLLCWRV